MKCLLVSILLIGAAAYAQIPANPHGRTTLDCNLCHSTAGWSQLLPVVKFDHNSTPFPLTGRHADVSCIACHSSLVFADAETQCLDCHQDVHRGQFSNACASCHSPDGWNVTAIMRERHQTTRFPLVGVHASLDCQACHANGQYVNLSADCKSCHLEDYEAVRVPDHLAAGFPTDCNQCHSVAKSEWKGTNYEHTRSFPLTGGHAINDCNRCHAQGFAVTTACYPCHTADYQSSANPAHEASGFPQNCEQCHGTSAWRPASYDHNLSDFPLTGAHVAVNCAQCHVNGQFTGTTSDCYGCHQADYEVTDNPDHEASNFPLICASCHSTTAWSPASFDHNLSSFPLTGAHVSVNCLECHVGGQYTGTPTACYPCHEDDFINTINPDHETLLFPQDCAMCHSTTGWQPATFDHNLTSFPLTGAHVIANCTQCHVDGQYTGTTTDCFECHRAEFEASDNPDHEAGNYPHNCAACHTTAAWQPANIDHNNTDFPLTGAHLSVDCAQCHIGGQYTNTPTACFACHENDYRNSTNPDHELYSFSQNCESCHSTIAWQPAAFDHGITEFPLTGRHVGIACSQCHVGGQYEGTPQDCWSCHDDDYAEVTDPNHAQNNYPHDCLICHSTAGWEPATFDHNNTEFPLTGRHVDVNCAECHVNGQFEGTPQDCWSCHDDDYAEVTDPNHAQNNYPHDCLVCHSTAGWEPSTFNHNNTDFPLTGAHIQTSCSECHINGQFEGTPTDCFFCHEDDYNDADDPDHQGAGFPTTCADCHNTTSWDNVNFNHDGQWFPIYSGRHDNEWNTCSECHPNQGNFAVFTCISCHEHNQNDMDDEHDEMNGYQYNSQACLTCHPDGESGDVPPIVKPRVRKEQ